MQLVLPYPLVIDIACTTSRDRRAPEAMHPITLEADGTVTLPHDIAAERIAAAFGGTSSCLDLIDHTIPAFHRWMALRRRDDPHPIYSPDAGISWYPTLRADCCLPTGYSRPDEAARHARDPNHLATYHHADVRQLRALVAGADLPEPEPPTDREDHRMWECGIDPVHAARIAARLPVRSRLPVDFHLAQMVTDPDLDWLASTLTGRRSARDLATWLAWTYDDTDRADPHDRRRWLDLGLSTWSIATLRSAGYTPADLSLLIDSWSADPEQVALRLADWVQHGHRPNPVELLRERCPSRELPPDAPSSTKIRDLRMALGICSRQSTDTELAQHLAHHDSVADTVRALHLAGYTRVRPELR